MIWREIWRYWGAAQREAAVINLSGAFCSVANLFGNPPVPFVLPLVGIAMSGYAIYLYRKIEKGER